MDLKKRKTFNRRDFIKKTGAASLAAGAFAVGAATRAVADDKGEEAVLETHWENKQKHYQTLEEANRKAWKAFDHPPKFTYRGTDTTDRTPTFYAPLMEECPYLPEFQSIFTEGTAGQYFKYTLSFGMKDIIRFHGHSCEALYYTAAICRLICDKMFPDGVADRTLLRGIGGQSP
ncbi:MAG: twin-arginine translocation signal domain-containing protein [Desulfatiglandaceae bacterium]